MTELTAEQWQALEDLVGPLHLPRAYCPVEPTVKQEWFLRRDELEAFFGGAAGPGKSWALLMAALQYVDVSGYDAIILRPTLSEFEQPGGLIPWSHDWLGPTDAWWHGSKRQWTFPSGATLRFGYLNNLSDMGQYKGAAYSFVGFDELTGFPELLYRAMFRVLRQPVPGDAGKGDSLEHVPLRMRGASNPGDVGHSWVKSRFVDPKTRDPAAVYVPALIQDNPHLDYVEYLKSLAHLSPVDRERLINGDWDVMEEGGKFRREDFILIDDWEAEPAVKTVRYWDLAASEESQVNPDPDYTVGLRLEQTRSGLFQVRHIVRGRWTDHDVEQIVRTTAEADGRTVPVHIEQEPGASGKALIGHYRRSVLAGFEVHRGLTRQQNKEVRARPVAAAVANGLVKVVRGQHLLEFLDECAIFPGGNHDDLVDGLSGAHTAITSTFLGVARTSVPRARIPGVAADARGSTGSAFGG